MKRFRNICLVLVLVFFLLGIVLGAVSCSMGTSKITRAWIRTAVQELNLGKWWNHSGKAEEVDLENLTEDATKETFSASEIRKIEMDVRTADITFCPAEGSGQCGTDQILVEKKWYRELQDISVAVKDDRLVVQESDENRMSLSEVHEKYRAKIKIYLPAYGEQDQFELSVKNDVGDVTISQALVLASLDLEQGVGDIEIPAEIKVSGDTILQGGTGDIRAENMSCSGKLRIDSGVGDILYCGTAEKGLEANTGTGDAEVRLAGDSHAYHYDISNGVGDLTVNGKTYDGPGHDLKEKCEHKGAPTIKIDSGAGNITLDIR